LDNCHNCFVIDCKSESTDIAMGVDKALEIKGQEITQIENTVIGAGDQGMMFGYATNETEDYMPWVNSYENRA